MNVSSSRGFTFLELLISLTIMSLVMVVVYAALNLGVRAVSRGEDRGGENQRARAALSLIARHLKSAYPLALQSEDGFSVYFAGEPDAVSFVSTTGRSETGGLEKVTYFLREYRGRRSLWVRTSAPALPADLLGDREGSLRQETEVLPEVESLTWEYLRTVQDREEWSERWNGKGERQLPVAIRLSWRARLGELPYQWQIEIPLNVQFPRPELLASPQQGQKRARQRFRGRRFEQ